MGPAAALDLKLLPVEPAEVLVFCCLQVDSPSCIWTRVSSRPETVGRYRQLTLQMNLFYHDVSKDQGELKPSMLEDGQVLGPKTTCGWSWTCVYLSIPLGVCGVLACHTLVVSGHGGVAFGGPGVLHGLLLAGGPRRTSRCLFRSVRSLQSLQELQSL